MLFFHLVFSQVSYLRSFPCHQNNIQSPDYNYVYFCNNHRTWWWMDVWSLLITIFPSPLFSTLPSITNQYLHLSLSHSSLHILSNCVYLVSRLCHRIILCVLLIGNSVLLIIYVHTLATNPQKTCLLLVTSKPLMTH